MVVCGATSCAYLTVNKSKFSLGYEILFPHSTLDNIALNDVAEDNSGSDIDKGEDDDIVGKRIEEEASESDNEYENEGGIYGTMRGTVWSSLKKSEHNHIVLLGSFIFTQMQGKM